MMVSNEIKVFLDKLDQLDITRADLMEKITTIRKMIINHIKYEHTEDETRMIRCLKEILFETNEGTYHKND